MIYTIIRSGRIYIDASLLKRRKYAYVKLTLPPSTLSDRLRTNRKFKRRIRESSENRKKQKSGWPTSRTSEIRSNENRRFNDNNDGVPIDARGKKKKKRLSYWRIINFTNFGIRMHRGRASE